MSQQPSPNTTLLPHSSLNDTGQITILLLHCGGSSRRSWDAVTSHLPSHYHILIPDLPSHGEAISITPFSLSTCIHLLSELIAQRAHEGRAHVVGLSIGAYVAIDLAIRHPELVSSVFASGYNRFEPSLFTPLISSVSWYVENFTDLMPKAVAKHFMDGADPWEAELLSPEHRRLSHERHKAFVGIITSGTWPEAWTARSIIVAATKGGLVPSFDKPAVAKQLVEICRKGGNEDVKAVQHHGMRHPWNVQDPKLFADAVYCFLERKPLPAGFEEV